MKHSTLAIPMTILENVHFVGEKTYQSGILGIVLLCAKFAVMQMDTPSKYLICYKKNYFIIIKKIDNKNFYLKHQ